MLAYEALLCDLVTMGVFLALLLTYTNFGIDWMLALLLAGFVLNPGLTVQRVGPRIFSLNERVFAEAIYAAFLLCLLTAALSNQVAMMFLACLLGCALVLSSKFGRQVLLFCPTITALLTAEATLLLVPLSAFLLALAIPGANFTAQAKEQIIHLRWYWQNLDRMWAGNRNSWANFQPEKGLSWGKINAYVFRRHAMSAGLLQNLLPLSAVAASFSMPLSSDMETLRAFYLSGVVVWLLTSFRPFVIVGEAERYLNHHCVLGYVVLGELLMRAESLTWLFVLCACLLWFLHQLVQATRGELRRMREFKERSVQSGRSAAMDFLVGRGQQLTVAIGRIGLAGELAYRTGSLPWFFTPAVMEGRTWTDLFSHYPNPKGSLLRSLAPRHVLAELATLEGASEEANDYRATLTNYRLIFQEKDYGVYER